jgi:hypothetical protein
MGNAGIQIRIWPQTSTAHLQTLSAHVNGVTTASTLASNGSSASANGRFLVVSLTITNNASAPEQFDSIGNQQTAIIGHRGASYSEDFNAENGPDQHSCVASNTNDIQPGESATCDVVFDLPVAAVDRARTHGLGLYVVNFGTDLSSNSMSPPHKVALITLSPFGSA